MLPFIVGAAKWLPCELMCDHVPQVTSTWQGLLWPSTDIACPFARPLAAQPNAHSAFALKHCFDYMLAHDSLDSGQRLVPVSIALPAWPCVFAHSPACVYHTFSYLVRCSLLL